MSYKKKIIYIKESMFLNKFLNVYNMFLTDRRAKLYNYSKAFQLYSTCK